MSGDEQQGNPYGSHGGVPGAWEPIPQSEGYDEGATAFVQLPPDFMLDGVPLEAPGHGYTPPMIVPLQPLTQAAATDPAATGTWNVHLPTEAEQVQYFDQSEHAAHAAHDVHAPHDPHATAEWNFTEVSGPSGQWEIPAVPETAPEIVPEAPPEPEAVVPEVPSYEPEAALYEAEAPSYENAPPTLPGGAPAPWALPEEPVAAAGEAVTEEVGADEAGAAEAAGPGVAGPEAVEAPEPESEPETAPEAGPEVAPEAGPDAEHAPVPAPPAPVPAYASTDSEEHPHTSYTLRVNGTDRPVTGSWIGESLLYVLRERLGLAGAKDGCSQGECGACNVQVDGRLVASCLVPAATAAGSEVRTVEGLAVDGEPSDVQRAMSKCGTVQCGFCIPGMCMTVHDLLEGNHAPTELETRQALAGNLCRCSGYRGVLEAVRDVVAEREATAAATAPTGPEAAEGIHVPQQIPHPHDGGMA
ncbi:2Fe-2S iron-sulfur cluster-binding protein [Streptomyces sp. NPDC020807]|uniref:(2Fe-2S)-binding protein n=1 Tax=Streptomyces sp. NPDC020807 TaxID=3155119 RepID=UPI0033F48A4A